VRSAGLAGEDIFYLLKKKYQKEIQVWKYYLYLCLSKQLIIDNPQMKHTTKIKRQVLNGYSTVYDLIIAWMQAKGLKKESFYVQSLTDNMVSTCQDIQQQIQELTQHPTPPQNTMEQQAMQELVRVLKPISD
jgi:hypothetical protein